MIRKIINKLIYPNHYSNDAYIYYLRKNGCKIGSGTIFYAPKLKPVDETSLHYIEIGKNCRITQGVIILAHDYSYAVLRPVYHCMFTKAAKTIIGDNVFIGINSVITMGTQIGNNVIVGSGSVVTKDVPDNCVVAGNPAKIICSLEEYYEKCKNNFEKGAVVLYEILSERLGRKIEEQDMGWYNVLWKSPNKTKIIKSILVEGDNPDEVYADVLRMPEKYESFEDFIMTKRLRMYSEK